MSPDTIAERIDMALAEVGFGDWPVVIFPSGDDERPFKVSFAPGLHARTKWMAIETARVGLASPVCFEHHVTRAPKGCAAWRPFLADCRAVQ